MRKRIRPNTTPSISPPSSDPIADQNVPPLGVPAPPQDTVMPRASAAFKSSVPWALSNVPPPRKRVASKKDDALQGIPLATARQVSATPEVNAYTLPSGKTFYVLAHEIGQGSYGRVYAAIDDLGALYALKATRPNGKPSPTRQRATMAITQIKKEFAMQKMFDARPDALELFRLGDDIFTTSVLCAGDLKQLRGILNPREKRDMAYAAVSAILQALCGVHGQHIGHGDLKPDNVFIDSAGVFHLGDVGGAGSMAARGKHETGDFDRLPPEQRAHGIFSAGTDMWGLGIVAWELASGLDNPLRGKQAEWCAWHASAPRDARGRIDVALSDTGAPDAWGARLAALPADLADIIINDLLHPDSAQRPEAASLLTRCPAVAPQTIALCAEKAKLLPTYVRAQALLRWFSTRDV